MGDREVIVRLRADISQYQRALATASAETQAFGRSTDQLRGPLGNVESQSKRTGNEIDKLSGRLRLATDAALILGPALVPLGAAAVGGVVGLAAELGALAGGLGVTLLATVGLSDGLKALDKYQLEPTTENLAKLNQEMGKLGPAGEDFVRFLDSIEPNLKTLQNAAREGLLPGAQEGIEALMGRLPELRKLIRGMATEMGDLAAGGGKAIAGERFDAFFKYLRTDGITILSDTSKTIGSLAESVANLFVAFGGVSTDFSGGLLKFSEGLAEASANLGTNAGFQEFVRYIETEGPHALEALGAIGDAFLQIVEATAPLGAPVLTALTALSKVIATIADSDLGTPIFAGLAALALFNRSVLLTSKLSAMTFGGPGVAMVKNYAAGLGTVVTAQDRATMSAKELAAAEAQVDKNLSGMAKVGKGAALIGALALANTGLAEQTGLSNTANLALMGTLAGPWGAAIGGGVGAVMDFKAAWGQAGDSIETFRASLNASKGDIQAQTALIDGMREAAAKAADDVNADSLFEGFKNQFDPDAGVAFYRSVLGMKSGSEQMSAAADEAQAKLDRQAEAEQRVAEGGYAVGAAVSSTLGPLGFLRAASEKSAEAADQQAAAINGAIQAMHDMREEALRAVNAELDYRASIRDANDALKENGKTVDKNSDKGEANLRALYNLAGAWNSQSEVIKGNSKSLAAARKNFIDTATAMGMAAGDARKLSRDLFDIPEKRETKIQVDTAAAEAALARLNRFQFDPKVIQVRVQAHGATGGGGFPADPAAADGMTVPGPRHPYGDKLTIRVAPGEEIITNRHGEADRFRADRASGRIPGYAGGGTPGGHSSRPYTVFTSGSDTTTQVIDSAHGLAQALRMLSAALAKSEKSLDKERSSRDDLQSQFDSIVSQVGGAYSTMDPFAAPQQSGSVWGAGANANPLTSFDAAVAGNTATTNAAQTALAFAQSHGLDGPLYAALAASGNLPLLQQFAQLSAADIDTREKAFAAQSAAQAGLGGMAAQAEVGVQLAAANKVWTDTRDEVRKLRHDVKQLDINNQAAQKQNAKDVKDGVNGAAGAGHKRGN